VVPLQEPRTRGSRSLGPVRYVAVLLLESLTVRDRDTTWERVLAVNLTSVMRLTRAVLPAIRCVTSRSLTGTAAVHLGPDCWAHLSPSRNIVAARACSAR
jgi:NAD(P)-dependent dehydrogenase (short-subunit alcohol dehydrogenase family)